MANEAINKRAWRITDRASEYPIVLRVGQVQHRVEVVVALEYLRDLRQALSTATCRVAETDDEVQTALEVATNEELLSELRKRLEKVR